MMSRNTQEYSDACIIGAYLMQSMIEDGGPDAVQCAHLMRRYCNLVGRALGEPQEQLTLDVTHKYKMMYTKSREL